MDTSHQKSNWPLHLQNAGGNRVTLPHIGRGNFPHLRLHHLWNETFGALVDEVNEVL